MQPDRTNIVVCPFCGAENIEGADTCENCHMDLRTTDVPETAQVASDSPLLTPISAVRLSKVTTIPAGATVAEAIAVLREEPTGAAVVLDGASIVGIFTERDVLKRIAARPERMGDALTRWMTPDPVVLRATDTIAAALNKMGAGGFRHIPLTHDGRLTAMVTARDILQWVMSRYFE